MIGARSREVAGEVLGSLHSPEGGWLLEGLECVERRAALMQGIFVVVRS